MKRWTQSETRDKANKRAMWIALALSGGLIAFALWLTGCASAPTVQVETQVVDKVRVPDRFLLVPDKPAPPAVTDDAVARWMADMDAAYDALWARYEALVAWVNDGGE